MESISQTLGFEARYLLYPLVALLAAGLLRWIIHRYLMGWAAKSETELDDQIIHQLDDAVLPYLLLAALYSLSRLFPLPGLYLLWIARGLVLVAVGLAVFYSIRISSLLIQGLADRKPEQERLTRPLSGLMAILLVLIGAAAGLRYLDFTLSEQGVQAIRILGILLGAYIVVRIVRLAVMRIQQLVTSDDPARAIEASKRANTIGTIINSFALVAILTIAIMLVLAELGIDVTPLLAGAGIVGLAVGFGAQNLVRDVISGLFLILEDQIRVGDVARINGTGGLVQAINLRTTVLRDLEGIVHIFPNGTIAQVSNLTKEWSRYVIDVGVAYKENVDRVMAVLKQIGAELQADPEFGPLILAPLEILGVDDFAASQVTIKIMIKTLPLKQWIVGRELRRRIKNTFDAHGIEIPFPHLSVYFGEASRPFALLQQSPPPKPEP